MAHHPLILIHGLGGRPEDWEIGGVTAFLVERGGYDRKWIRLFDYGTVTENGETRYNYQGDICQIAHRLDDDPRLPDTFPFQVDRLSRESVAHGGPAQVDIVTFSMGGVVARYYLGQRQEDAWGTRYRGNVRKLIQIGAPNLGVDWIGLYNHHLRGSWIWRVVVQLSKRGVIPINLASDVERMQAKLRALHTTATDRVLDAHDQPISADGIATQQIAPDSEFLAAINRPGQMPGEVEYACIFGDLVAAFRLRIPAMTVQTEFSMGDLLVTASSASNIPGVQPKRRAFRKRYELTLGEPESRAELQGRALLDPPAYSHVHLLEQSDVHETVLRLLQN